MHEFSCLLCVSLSLSCFWVINLWRNRLSSLLFLSSSLRVRLHPQSVHSQSLGCVSVAPCLLKRRLHSCQTSFLLLFFLGRVHSRVELAHKCRQFIDRRVSLHLPFSRLTSFDVKDWGERLNPKRLQMLFWTPCLCPSKYDASFKMCCAVVPTLFGHSVWSLRMPYSSLSWWEIESLLLSLLFLRKESHDTGCHSLATSFLFFLLDREDYWSTIVSLDRALSPRDAFHQRIFHVFHLLRGISFSLRWSVDTFSCVLSFSWFSLATKRVFEFAFVSSMRVILFLLYWMDTCPRFHDAFRWGSFFLKK